MVYKRLACALSVSALAIGAGVFMPAAWAEGACEASDLEGLETCLADESADSITTTNTIVVTGENVDKTLVINKDIMGASGKDVFHVEDGAKLTLRGSGTITAGRYGAIADGAELVIDGVRIEATNPASYGVYAKENGRVTIESGQVVADYAAFAGNNTTGDMNFYINGGQLISNRYPAIYMPGQVDLQMRGGTLTGGIVARMGQIVIEGGTINAQPTPVESDGIDQNYSSMPSVADEAITLLAGSYKSANAEHGNSMNLTIGGDNTQINGDIALYDFGNTAEGYEQDVNVQINGGRLTGFKTKFTEEEIGFSLKSGYEAGRNNSAGSITTEIWGGEFTTEPAEEDIAPGNEAELNTETGAYEIFPKQVDWGPEGYDGIESDWTDENQLPVYVEFGDEMIADRKATLSAYILDTNELTLTGDGELIGALNITMHDRDGNEIEVKDKEMTIYIDIDEETYNLLAAYDKIEVVYFDADGNEVERIDAELKVEHDEYVNPETGEEFSWTYYWVEFNTTHLSAYGVVGIDEEDSGSESSSEASTPDTGTVTMAGASASTAAIVTALVSGVLTAVVSFTYLYKKLYLNKK